MSSNRILTKFGLFLTEKQTLKSRVRIPTEKYDLTQNIVKIKMKLKLCLFLALVIGIILAQRQRGHNEENNITNNEVIEKSGLRRQ